MSIVDRDGNLIETPLEVTQADNSKNTFVMLLVSLVALAIMGAVLLWYFGVVEMF